AYIRIEEMDGDIKSAQALRSLFGIAKVLAGGIIEVIDETSRPRGGEGFENGRSHAARAAGDKNDLVGETISDHWFLVCISAVVRTACGLEALPSRKRRVIQSTFFSPSASFAKNVTNFAFTFKVSFNDCPPSRTTDSLSPSVSWANTFLATASALG